MTVRPPLPFMLPSEWTDEVVMIFFLVYVVRFLCSIQSMDLASLTTLLLFRRIVSNAPAA